MDPIKTIGQILSENEERRDAIHIAIMPVVCDDSCWPGNEVKLIFGTKDRVRCLVADEDKPVGIIDPFIRHGGNLKGKKVWLFLYPGTVTSMRHQWSHPDIDSPAVIKNDSEHWLRGFADKWNFDYDDMINVSQEEEGILVARGIDLHSSKELDAGDESAFWHHIAVVTGKIFTSEHREKFIWSCSC